MAFRRLQQISREVIRAMWDTEVSVKEGGGDVLKQSNNLARSSKPEPNLHSIIKFTKENCKEYRQIYFEFSCNGK